MHAWSVQMTSRRAAAATVSCAGLPPAPSSPPGSDFSPPCQPRIRRHGLFISAVACVEPVPPGPYRPASTPRRCRNGGLAPGRRHGPQTPVSNRPWQAALAAGALLYALDSPGVHAQSTEPVPSAALLDAVQVTGSHIRGAELSGVGPVTVVDAQAIERSGVSSIEVLLQRLPVSAGAAGNQTNAYWTGDGWGTSQVSLRGLGPSRTLVLLNGRRVVAGGTGANSAVDLNAIPVAMIQRIEILKDGASAIYGADAVAGVVNIITKHGLDGAEFGVKVGQTTRNDGEDMAADLAWGTRSDRGFLTLGLSYSEGRAVRMSDRQPCALGEVAGRLECVGSSSTIGGRALLADGTMVNFNQVPGGDGDFYEPYGPQHNADIHAALNAVNPIQRLSMTAFGNLALTDDVTLFTELLHANRQSEQLASPGSLGQYRAVDIAAGHPTNPTGQDLVLQRRRLEEGGPRIAYQDVDTVRAVLGLEGRFGNGWSWDAAVNYGRSTSSDGFTNVANLDRVENTLDTGLCSNASGAAIPCADYLGYGDVTPDVLDYILFTTRNSGGNDLLAFTANVGGELLELPAGRVEFASGIEIREESGWRHPDALTRLGIANTNLADDVDGEYRAREAFVEFSVPLLEGLALADSMTFNAALRYSDYDLFGSDANYKLSLDWQLVPSFKLRATRATAFRIPSIPQLFGGVSTGNLTTSDPCSDWSSLPASSTLHLNCQADGVPAGYTQLGNTVLTTGGGNIDLQPEDADTLSVGAAWTPASAPGLTLAVDYYDIRIDNAVQSVAGSTKLALCYDTPELAHPFCADSHFTRNPATGEIDFLSNQPVNAASEQISGVDLGLLYAFDAAGLQATVDIDVSYLREYSVRPYEGADLIEYAGRITGGQGSYAKWRSYGSLTLAQGPWTGAWSVQYIGHADDINANPGDIGARAPSMLYHNAWGRYAFGEAFDIALGIDNLFDRRAPFIRSYTDANTDTMTYDLLGRRWHLALNYRW